MPRKDHSEDHWEVTPTFLYGLTDNLMLDAHGHFSRFRGKDPFVEAITVGLQYKLTHNWPFHLDTGFVLEYEHPTKRAQSAIDGIAELTGTLVVSREWPNDVNTVANVSYTQETRYGNNSTTSYAFGMKSHLIPSLESVEMGVEFVGTLVANKEARMIPGTYMNFAKDWILKLGTGFGLTNHSDDYSFHIHFVYNFPEVFARPLDTLR